MAEAEAKAPAQTFAIGKSPSAPAGKPVNAIDPTKAPAPSAVVSIAPFRVEAVHERDRWFKALWYANHGYGKTDLAGSSVDVEFMRDVILLDLEKGERTIQESRRIENKDLIDRIECNSFKQVAQVYDFLKAHCKFREENNERSLTNLQAMVFGVAPNEIDRLRRYKTVIVDTVTELDLYSMQEVMKQEDIAKVLAGEIDVAEWPQFRKNGEKVKLLLRSLRDLPMHVVFLAQRRYSQDEMKRYHYGPAMTGALQGAVQGYVDMVGYLRVEDPTPEKPFPRRLYVQPVTGIGPRFDAKNRRASFTGAYFDDPVMQDIMFGIGLTKAPPEPEEE